MKAAVFLLAGACIVPVGAWGWALAVHRWRRGRSLLAPEPRRPVPWSLLEVLVAVLVLGLLSTGLAAVQQLLHPHSPATPLERSPETAALAVLLEALAKIGTVVLITALMRLAAGTTWQDLGWDARKIGADMRLGLVAFAMLAPPVYGLHKLLIVWFPSRHPLIDLARENPDPRVLWAMGIGVLFAAPLAEEFFFRVLLQGWLERVVPVWHAWLQGLYVEVREAVLGMDRADAGNDKGGAVDREEAGRRARDTCLPSDHSLLRLTPWPVLLSAALFAGLHWSHGPDPIPLFVLAVGLGYLYQQTHRFLPCVVVHFLLNGCTMAILLVELLAGRGP